MIVFTSIFAKEIEEYLSLKKISYAYRTYRNAEESLTLFDEYLLSRGHSCREITEDLYVGWIRTLKGSSGTIEYKAGAVKTFIDYLGHMGIQAPKLSVPQRIRNYIPFIFTSEELKRILDVVDSCVPFRKKTRYELMHYQIPMLVRILYSCGCRIGEILCLKVKDIDFERGVLKLTKTKGNIERYVPMHSTLVEQLHDYCSAVKNLNLPDSYVFCHSLSEKSKHIPMVEVSECFRHYLVIAGIRDAEYKGHERGPCLHCFRHTFAINSLVQLEKSGIIVSDKYPYLSTYMGHLSLKETEKYLKMTPSIYPESMEAFNSSTSFLFEDVNFDE